ncbi:MAG: acyloxyacyl hydrolase [Bacteroidales bacterium]|nr:acyloxyacyl hydrolase [Bacteroidales bacterium]
MRKNKIFLLVILLLLFYFNSISQVPNIFGGKIGYGFIMPHSPDMRYFIEKRITQFNVNIGFQTVGKKTWQQDWGFPELGVGFYYANLGNPTVLGCSKAAYFYFDMPILSDNFFALSFYVGLGMSHLSKIFNYQTNITNIAIGTHFNIYANVNLEAQLRMKKFIYFADFGITHYSNGGSKKPNLGLNVIALSLGMKYKAVNFAKNKGMSSNFSPHYDIQILQTITARAAGFSVSQKSMLVVGLSADYGRYLSNKSRIGAGLEFLYDANAIRYFEVDNEYNSTNLDYFSTGVHVSYSAVIGNVQFTFQQLFFLYQKYNFYKHWQRYGFRLLIGDNMVLGAALSAYYFQALFIEPSFGFRFGT